MSDFFLEPPETQHTGRPDEEIPLDDLAAAHRHLESMRAEGESKGVDTMRCIEGELMLYLPFDRALVPGHIYSMDGIREARISKSCEYHFDKWFQEGWVDILTGEPGHMPADEGDLDG